MDSSEMPGTLLSVTVCTLPFPDYFIDEVVITEDSVHNHLEIVGGVRVAMQVNAPRRFKHSPNLIEAWSNPAQIL